MVETHKQTNRKRPMFSTWKIINSSFKEIFIFRIILGIDLLNLCFGQFQFSYSSCEINWFFITQGMEASSNSELYLSQPNHLSKARLCYFLLLTCGKVKICLPKYAQITECQCLPLTLSWQGIALATSSKTYLK